MGRHINITMINDERGLELPINIVVMLVVGMVALAALIAIIPAPTKTMSVSMNPNMIAASASDFTDDVEDIKVTVTDPDGNPVQDATCVLRGGGGVASATSESDGVCNLKKIGDGDFTLPGNKTGRAYQARPMYKSVSMDSLSNSKESADNLPAFRLTMYLSNI